MKNLLWLTCGLAAAAACGDDKTGNPVTPDASVEIDAPPVTPDAPPDAPPTPFVPPTPSAIALSAEGTDQLLGVTAGPNGTFYAVGFRAPTTEATADRETVVVKLTATGALDTTWGGGDGIVSHNVIAGGAGEALRSIVVQPSGKIVVFGQAEDEVVAADRDLVLLRFNADGTLDNDFGTAGVVRHDLSTALPNGMGGVTGAEAAWEVATDTTGRLYLHSGQRAAGTRTDTDFAITRLTVDGELDTNYATGGTFRLDIQMSSASVRGLIVLADGSVLGGGYANSTGVGSVQPVVYKLTPAGELDANFATGGVFHELVLPALAEVYDLVAQGDKFVTTGYGKTTADGTNDLLSLRFTAAGALDAGWADAGKLVVDVSGAQLADTSRSLIALPGGRTLLLASRGATAGNDAAFAVVDDTGAYDADFGGQFHALDLGGGGDQFWAAAVSGSNVLMVGHKGAGAMPTATNNDDAFVALMPLP